MKTTIVALILTLITVMITRSERRFKYLRAEPPPQSQKPAMFIVLNLVKVKKSFSNFHLTSGWSYDQRILCLQGWETLTVSQHVTYFGIYGTFASRGIMCLICRVTSQDHLIKG